MVIANDRVGAYRIQYEGVFRVFRLNLQLSLGAPGLALIQTDRLAAGLM